uniref:Putative secreted protein n=1 Tax=Ixodes ricinus TaxID=34613 RepID=A0A147BC05_IXORI
MILAYCSFGRIIVLYASSFVEVGARCRVRLKKPRDLNELVTKLSICCFHERVSEMFTPRYLYSETHSSCCMSNVYWLYDLFEFVVTVICLHLSGLTVNCHCEQQEDIASRSFWRT